MQALLLSSLRFEERVALIGEPHSDISENNRYGKVLIGEI